MRRGLLAVALAPCLALPLAAQAEGASIAPCAATGDATPGQLREALKTLQVELLAGMRDSPPDDALDSLRAAAEVALLEAALGEPAECDLTLRPRSHVTPLLCLEARELRSITHQLGLRCGCCSLSVRLTRDQAEGAFAAIDELWTAVTEAEAPDTPAAYLLQASPGTLDLGSIDHTSGQPFALVIEGAGNTTPTIRAPGFVADCTAHALPGARAGGRWLIQGRIAIAAPGARRDGQLVVTDGWKRTVAIPIRAQTNWLWKVDRAEVVSHRRSDGRWEAVIDCQRLDAAPPGMPRGEVVTPRPGLSVTIIGNGPRRCRVIITQQAKTSAPASVGLHCPGHEQPLLVQLVQ